MTGRIGPVKVARLALARATLGDLWDHLARAYGDRVVLTLEEPLGLRVLDGRRLSYGQLAQAVARVAGALRELGVGPGTRVAICTENRIDYALNLFAVVRAGGLAIPLHHHLKKPEVAAMVARAEATLLIADRGVASKLSGVRTVIAGPGGELDKLAAKALALAAEPLSPEDPAVILYTSGTTGAPKGATLTSRSLLAVARLAALMPGAVSENGVCGLPLAHVMGISTLLAAALAGAPMHWLAKFDAKIALQRISEHRATFFVGVPAMYGMMAAAKPESFDLSSVKLFASGADVMPPPLIDRFKALGAALTTPLGQRVLDAAFAEFYGMVELSGPAILKLHLPAPLATRPLTDAVRRARVQASASIGQLASKLGVKLTPAEARAGESSAVGIPIPPFRARVVDEHGQPVKAGVVGELVLQGPGVTRGYDRDPDATAKSTRDGWLHTGDLARRSRLGLIGFVTRKKDVIKHGGFSVFPAEVEAQLAEHPAVAEAIVFGAPHPTKGAVPVAAVVVATGKKASERSLLAWSRENIAPFKAPRAIVKIRASQVPRNPNKKVLKDQLREQLMEKIEKQLAEGKRHG